MRILVTGAAGMIGAKLVARLAERGSLQGKQISDIHLFDVIASPEPAASGIVYHQHIGDIAAPETAAALAVVRPEVIFHLASIVSGEAELDFEKGYRINLVGGQNLMRELQLAGIHPRFVFSSSSAVYGGPFPPGLIEDDFHPTPHTSYGTQKLILETLINDFTRRGLMDGVSVRLPSICIRPGKPNKAASGFYSNIIREPLNGTQAVVPVDRAVMHSSASPRAAVNHLIHAAEIDTGLIGPRRALNMPGVVCSVGDQIEAMVRVAGAGTLRYLRDEIDPMIARMVATWPIGYVAKRATNLGFCPDKDFDDIIRIYIAEEMPNGVTEHISQVL